MDQLKGEIQELKKIKICIKSKSPDKKEELLASSSSNNPPPPPDPPTAKPTKTPPKPSRRKPETPAPAEPQAIANQKSTPDDAPPSKPTKAPPRPSRRRRLATPEQTELEVIANEVSGAEEVTTSTSNRGGTGGKTKLKKKLLLN